MNDRQDVSWWTEDNNEFMMRYLDKELHRIIEDPKALRANRIMVTCVRCRAKVVEVVQLKLPDDAETVVHAIGFRKFSQLPLDVDLPDSAAPDELARARAKARKNADPSYRLRPWDWIYKLEGSTRLLKIKAGHTCKDPEGKRFSDERLLPAQKIIDREITTVDPGPPEWRRQRATRTDTP